MTARLDEICRSLSVASLYAAELDEGGLRIRELESGSEYLLEMFGQSAQIRQAIWFDCHDMPEDELNRIHALCSMMNQRFSGCKSYVDKWGALTTAADILEHDFSAESVTISLGQIEFVSLAMLDLVEIQHQEARLVTETEIDSALVLPPLH